MITGCSWCGPKPEAGSGELTLSHGICPACVEKHFPGLMDPAPSRRRVLAGKLARGFVELRGRARAGIVRVLRRGGGPAAW